MIPTYRYMPVAEQIAAAEAEKKRREELDASVDDFPQSPPPRWSPRAEQALRNLGILD